jgi:hypothetical protein
MSVCCICCVLSGRGLCDGPIPRPEKSYQLRMSLCVIQKPQELGGPARRWAVASESERQLITKHNKAVVKGLYSRFNCPPPPPQRRIALPPWTDYWPDRRAILNLELRNQPNSLHIGPNLGLQTRGLSQYFSLPDPTIWNPLLDLISLKMYTLIHISHKQNHTNKQISNWICFILSLIGFKTSNEKLQKYYQR